MNVTGYIVLIYRSDIEGFTLSLSNWPTPESGVVGFQLNLSLSCHLLNRSIGCLKDPMESDVSK